MSCKTSMTLSVIITLIVETFLPESYQFWKVSLSKLQTSQASTDHTRHLYLNTYMREYDLQSFIAVEVEKISWNITKMCMWLTKRRVYSVSRVRAGNNTRSHSATAASCPPVPVVTGWRGMCLANTSLAYFIFRCPCSNSCINTCYQILRRAHMKVRT